MIRGLGRLDDKSARKGVDIFGLFVVTVGSTPAASGGSEFNRTANVQALSRDSRTSRALEQFANQGTVFVQSWVGYQCAL